MTVQSYTEHEAVLSVDGQSPVFLQNGILYVPVPAKIWYHLCVCKTQVTLSKSHELYGAKSVNRQNEMSQDSSETLYCYNHPQQRNIITLLINVKDRSVLNVPY